MNKKIIISILLIIALLATCLIMSGCGKNKEDKNKETAKLVDEYAPFEFAFKYPKDAGYKFEADLENIPYVTGKLTNEEKNIKIKFTFDETTDSSFKSSKESVAEKENYAETNYTNLGGYEYYTDKEYLGVNLLNTFEEFRHMQVTVNMEKYSLKGAEVNLVEFAKSEEFKEILSSMTFNNNIEGIKVDGIISKNHKLIIKELENPDESKYEVKQYQTTLGIMNAYILKDSNKEVQFKLEYYGNTGNYKDLETCIAHQEKTFKKKFEDYTLFGQKVKVNVADNAKYAYDGSSDGKYAKWLTGFFERNGKVYEFSYIQHTGIEDSIGEQLFNYVLNNSTVQD